MPLTCSHPAAILPFRRFTPNRLSFAALVIGSMSPDAGYFIGERGLAKIAHQPIGTVVICIPTGLVLLGLFYLIRRELCFILPSPHRNQLTPLAHQKPVFTPETLLIAIVSILLGAWTHIIWDQFTHDGSYVSRHFAPLRMSLAHIGPQDITIAYVLQYISTLAGGAILALHYFKWLRSQSPKSDNQPDAWRYYLWCSLALVSLAAGDFDGHSSQRPRPRIQNLPRVCLQNGRHLRLGLHNPDRHQRHPLLPPQTVAFTHVTLTLGID